MIFFAIEFFSQVCFRVKHYYFKKKIEDET